MSSIEEKISSLSVEERTVEKEKQIHFERLVKLGFDKQEIAVLLAGIKAKTKTKKNGIKQRKYELEVKKGILDMIY